MLLSRVFLSESLSLFLNSDFGLPGPLFLCDFSTALIPYKVRPAWPLRTHAALPLWLCPFANLEFEMVFLESETKENGWKLNSWHKFNKHTKCEISDGGKKMAIWKLSERDKDSNFHPNKMHDLFIRISEGTRCHEPNGGHPKDAFLSWSSEPGNVSLYDKRVNIIL